MRTPWWPRRWWLRIRPAMRCRTNCAPPCSAPPRRPTIQGPRGCWRCSAQPAWRPTARPSSPCARPIGKRNPWPPFRPSQWGASRFMGAHRGPPRGRFALSIDAGPAFGSGRHETTQGCLLALDWLARRRRVRRAFDIGTGSGILAVAATRLWPAQVLALDSDPTAVAAARETVRQNALSRRVSVVRGRGLPPA